MNHKVWTITLCHNDPGIIEDSIARYYATKHPDVETEHILVDQHWPIKRAETAQRLKLLADRYGCLLLDPGKNLGLHDGFNWAYRQRPIPGNAMVIGYDPDSWPLQSGWDMAMCNAFVADPKAVWFSLWHTHATRQLILEGNGQQMQIAGMNACIVRRPVMNSICGFRRDWLEYVGGLWEGNRFYGGLECAMFERMGPGNKWIFLRDFEEDLRMHDRVDPLYREYKWEHAHTRKFTGSFEEFVKERNAL